MLISTADLAQALSRPDHGYVVFDCRHDLVDHGKGERLYREGHLAGAFFASVEMALAGPKTGTNGRHPLPAPAAFADWLAGHGVTPATRVVAYDDAGGLYAARLWWLARWIGWDNVVLLDGGLNKWLAEGRALTTAVPVAMPVAVSPVRVEAAAVWSAADVLARLGEATSALIDARAAERYRGDVEPIDPVAGHIPGALNRFFKANLRADLTLKTPAELRAEFVALLGGRAPERTGHQCGSGITACANIFAMEAAGLRGSKLYAGSWSEWVSDPARPVARGTE